VEQFACRTESDPRTLPDLKLAALIASGKLHAQSTAYVLIRLMGEMSMKQSKKAGVPGCQSRLQGCSQEEVNSVGFMLAELCKNDEAVKTFGYRKPCVTGDRRHSESGITPIDRFQFGNPHLPRPFMALKNASTMKENTRKVLTLLGVLWQRGWVVIADETNFAPGSPYVFSYMAIGFRVRARGLWGGAGGYGSWGGQGLGYRGQGLGPKELRGSGLRV